MTYTPSLTDTQLRATALAISGSVSVGNFPASQTVTGTVTVGNASLAVTGPLTDTQLRAVALPISGTVTVSGVATETTLAALNAKIGAAGQALMAGSTPVVIASNQSALAVTGPLTDTQLRAAAVPVSGTFFQATQPVSGTVTTTVRGGAKGTTVAADVTSAAIDANTQALHTNITNASLAVTGPLTDTQLRATAVPVSNASLPLPTGASTEATLAALNTKIGAAGQALMAGSTPVVIASNQTALPVSGPLTDTQLRAAAVAISGSVTATLAAGTAAIGTVGVTSLPALVAGTAAIGTVAINAALPAGTNSIGTSPGPALTKGTQGTVGHSTQDLKDAGRVIKVFSATFTGATAEALISLTPITDGSAGTAATTHAVTAGKRLRIEALLVTTRNAAAAAQGIAVHLRMTATGAVAVGSPMVATCAAGTGIAIANVTDAGSASIPDGLEFSGTMQFGVSQVGSATANNTVTLIGYEY